MTQRRQRFRFTLEPRQPFRIAAEFLWQRFDRHFTLQLGIPRTVDLTHTAATQEREDFVGAELGSGGEAHFASLSIQLTITVIGAGVVGTAGFRLRRNRCPLGVTSQLRWPPRGILAQSNLCGTPALKMPAL